MSSRVAPHLLVRSSRPSRGGLELLGTARFARARAHEICGASRRTLALMAVAATEGVVYWIQPYWRPERLNGNAVAEWVDPGRIVFVHPRRGGDLLWVVEEVLRSGAVPVVVADLPEPPGMTPVRRLHLAAEAGASTGLAPVGLLLTPGRGGAPGIETRWSFAPAHTPDGGRAWRLERLRARAEPPAAWRVTQGPEGFATHPVAPVEAGPGPGAVSR